MKRSGPLKRKTPLARGGPMRRTPMKPTRRKVSDADFHPAVRAAIERRSGGRCEAAVDDVCAGVAAHVHHVLRRSQGGKGTVDNGLHVCAPCHTWLHAHVGEAVARGWLRRSGG